MTLTTFENPENIMDSYLAGTDGYVVKDIAPEDLINAVKCVNKGLKVNASKCSRTHYSRV